MSLAATLITVALGVVSIATLAGLGLMRGLVVNLREQLAEERAAKVEMRAERAEDRAQIEHQKVALEALAKIVTGDAHWVEVTNILQAHDNRARDHWKRAEAGGAAMLTAIRALIERLDDMGPNEGSKP